ncbi:protein FAM8A1 [Sorex fumeus]|uniref:protein FAM8A1 n=1 Tax=Sorex fumeus TaxID=62283 RepID=UPI0024ADE3BC|nr:protein FAM8A1 [Sorex fumeus]
MAEGPEEARGRPPGHHDDDGGGGSGDREPGPSLRSSSAAAAGPPAEPQAPGRPPCPPCPPAAGAEGPEVSREPAKRGDSAERERPARLSAREYSRQVHEWLWQSYCGYLTWHSGLAAFPYCSPLPPPPPLPLTTPTTPTSAPAAAAAAPPAAAPPPPPPPPLGYYHPFYFLSAAAAAAAGAGTGTEPGAPAGLPAPAPAAGLGPRAAPVPGSVRPAPLTRVAAAASSRSPSETGRQAGREYVIPSLAHRFMAEMVDFFILFFIKATIVLSIMHLSGIKDISKFAMHYIIEEIDEDTSMEDLQKMMVVALIYRLLVCFYEIICIWGAGGATPGKFLLGLRVVTCDTSVLIAPSRVLVIPSSNVSITTSTIRALIKNFSIASFFPAFITLLFFQHNRTAYDIVAGTIVVKRNGVR